MSGARDVGTAVAPYSRAKAFLAARREKFCFMHAAEGMVQLASQISQAETIGAEVAGLGTAAAQQQRVLIKLLPIPLPAREPAMLQPRGRWKRGSSKIDPARASGAEEAAGEMNGSHPPLSMIGLSWRHTPRYSRDSCLVSQRELRG